jgi:hypothetical protein
VFRSAQDVRPWGLWLFEMWSTLVHRLNYTCAMPSQVSGLSASLALPAIFTATQPANMMSLAAANHQQPSANSSNNTRAGCMSPTGMSGINMRDAKRYGPDELCSFKTYNSESSCAVGAYGEQPWYQHVVRLFCCDLLLKCLLHAPQVADVYDQIPTAATVPAGLAHFGHSVPRCRIWSGNSGCTWRPLPHGGLPLGVVMQSAFGCCTSCVSRGLQVLEGGQLVWGWQLHGVMQC